jgi:hypothetical protein
MTGARKRLWSVGFLSVLLAAMVVGVSPVAGTTVVKADVPALSRWAASVVEADVADVSYAWNAEHTQIHTYVTLNVTDVFAGDVAVGSMEIRLMGGAVGDTALTIPGAPTFTVGERVVLFLYDDPGLFIPVVGLYQGKLSFSVDPQTGREVVGNQHVGFFDKAELRSSVNRARGGR